MMYIHNRAEKDGMFKMLFNYWVSFRQGNKHDHRTLWVTNIVNESLVGHVRYILESSRKIESAHILVRKLPELVIFVWI